MIWQWSRAASGPVAMRARWKQVRRAGVVGLHPFTGAELGSVTLDAEAALALAGRADGVVIDTYGFPVDRPEDLLPR